MVGEWRDGEACLEMGNSEKSIVGADVVARYPKTTVRPYAITSLKATINATYTPTAAECTRKTRPPQTLL